MTICEPFDVVEVPFPFSDTARAKMRKALVLSSVKFNERNGSSILMMITSVEKSHWFLDTPIDDLEAAGLKKACVARFKLFTLDNALVVRVVGKLSQGDEKRVRDGLANAIVMEHA